MLTKQREKGRSKGGKGETFSAQQLQQAHEEYDNETTLFVFRLKSLKQGQTRSLLTQAARHHAAQLCFFKKALNSLEEVEPHVKMVTESQHIDYHFSGLEDDDENNDEDDSEVNDDGELSFEYRVNDKDQNADSSPSVSSQLGLFPETGLDDGQAGGVGGLVVIRDLDHYSYCESCLLPFQVKCHIGYVPSSERVLGLSKFSRVTDVFAKRLQKPQRLAEEICSALQHWVEPSGVAVVLQCSHPHRGFVEVTVSSGSGGFEDESSDLWCEFLSLLKFKGVKLSRDVSVVEDWCPFGIEDSSDADSELVSSVVSILRALGEDPARKELVSTPTRYLKWMMKFQKVNFEMKLNRFDCKLKERRLSYETNIKFWSMCEHHLLPFYGVVHVGYFCGDGPKPLEKSLVESVVKFYGFKLQVQERMTRQIAETLSPQVNGDIIVVVEAEHTCMISRGIEKFGSSTATVAVLGRFSSDLSARTKFIESIQKT